MKLRLPTAVNTVSPRCEAVLNATRAVAACLVVLFHARIIVVGGGDALFRTFPDAIPYLMTNYGTVAVFWFFVLSGYLVGGSVISGLLRGDFNFLEYAIMRLSRLYIVLIPALVFCYVLDFTRVSTYGYNYSAGFETAKSYTIATELGNVLFLQTLLVPTSGSNWALWSLACEFWYYAVFPLLLLPLFSSRGKGVRLTGFLTGIAILLVLGMLNKSVVWLFTIWCFGAAIRVLPTTSRVPEGFLWLLAIFASLGQPYVPTSIRPLGTIAVGITAAAVLWGIRPGAFVPPLTDKLARWFSQFSFSLYLIHAPLLHFLVTVPWGQKEVDLNIQPYSLRAPVLIASLVIAAYLVAFLFYNLTERHTQAFRRFVMMSFRSKLEPRSRAVLISPP